MKSSHNSFYILLVLILAIFPLITRYSITSRHNLFWRNPHLGIGVVIRPSVISVKIWQSTLAVTGHALTQKRQLTVI